MLSKVALPIFIAATFSSTIVQSMPLNAVNGLMTRDNKYNLKCSNAPQVTAGELVNPDDTVLTTSLPLSGSSQQWLKYLYCTPNTKTYTFFNIGEMNPAPGTGTATPGYRDVHGAFNIAAATVNVQAQNDGPIENGNWTMQADNTNIEIGVKNAKGTVTYGILASTFSGLADAMLNYNTQNNPIIFQINDGNWGEVGIGYAGYKNGVGQCIIMENATANYQCKSAMNGYMGDFS
ncbi:hypothetical protein ACLMJK_008688 [Lecanora helva]